MEAACSGVLGVGWEVGERTKRPKRSDEGEIQEESVDGKRVWCMRE